MTVTVRDMEHVAALARLELSEQEKRRLFGDMEKIIGYFESINQLDLSGIEPTSHVLPLENIYREDRVTPSMDRESLLANAGEADEGCFRVVQVVE